MHHPFKMPQASCGPPQMGSHLSEQFALYLVVLHSVVKEKDVVFFSILDFCFVLNVRAKNNNIFFSKFKKDIAELYL